MRLMLLGFLLCAAPSFAQMYKWVDEKGVTHYSEKPPPGRKAQQIQSAPSSPPSSTPKPADSASTWGEKERALRQRTIEREHAEETQRKKDAERVAMRREACLEARHLIEVLGAQQPVYWMNEKGEREYLADSARPEALRRAKQNADTYCRPE